MMGLIFYSQVSLSAEAEDKSVLLTVKKLLENIKNDGVNDSFQKMIQGKVMQEHSLSAHEKNQPYFYSDDVSLIHDIISLVLEAPQDIMDETATTGMLKIYREFDYPKEIAELFEREERAPRKFQEAYLGQTITGPTNKVVVTLKIKSDEQNEATLEKRLTYTKNNIQYLDAHPVKGSPVERKTEEDKTEESKALPE
jgi:hypothetical protein